MRWIACLLAGLAAASGQRLLPIDDSHRNHEFRGFVRKLQAAAAKQDVKGLRKLLDDDVISGTEGKKDLKGWTEFRKRWQPDDPRSDVWDVLAKMCDLGFVGLHPEMFVSPYVAWKFPRDVDPRGAWVVTRSSVPLRAAPDREGRVTATLEFDIVREAGAAPATWRRVRTNDGKEGFVLAQHLLSPNTPRGQFARKQGRWLIVALER
jgi:hypothetical protein